MKRILSIALAAASASAAFADPNYFNLSSGTFMQDWSNTDLITVNDDWSGVPSIMGFLGRDDTQSVTGVDPRTILGDLAEVDVIANQTNPNTLTNGGVAEFHITNPTIALNGSGMADAPGIVLYMNAANRINVTLSLDLIDLDGSTDNAIQQVAVQYRIGDAGLFANVPGGYVADATQGPSLSGQVTNLTLSMPEWSGVSNLQLRVLTTNAVGNDEWVGIDNIMVSSQPVPEPATLLALTAGLAALLARRRR
ncbi:MAG TPA: PEP-CTERM sorting domain-containing protein [Fimbriimonadaceae bacterium]|nr:PEP-CTERM sorting domain-containing protein [Fimbriimonadaceae bacterium]